jgi:hypothetical protein
MILKNKWKATPVMKRCMAGYILKYCEENEMQKKNEKIR